MKDSKISYTPELSKEMIDYLNSDISQEEIDANCEKSMIDLFKKSEEMEKTFELLKILFVFVLILPICGIFFNLLFVFFPITILVYYKLNSYKRMLNCHKHFTSFLLDIHQKVEIVKIDPSQKVII